MEAKGGWLVRIDKINVPMLFFDNSQDGELFRLFACFKTRKAKSIGIKLFRKKCRIGL